MDRIIKFREYSEDRGMDYNPMNGTFGSLNANFKFNNSSNIMQYTGLTDKNGKEVYEGDIVSASGLYGSALSVVEWNNDYIRFDLKAIESSGILGRASEEDLEVIGNIYENKELLNG